MTSGMKNRGFIILISVLMAVLLMMVVLRKIPVSKTDFMILSPQVGDVYEIETKFPGRLFLTQSTYAHYTVIKFGGDRIFFSDPLHQGQDTTTYYDTFAFSKSTLMKMSGWSADDAQMIKEIIRKK